MGYGQWGIHTAFSTLAITLHRNVYKTPFTRCNLLSNWLNNWLNNQLHHKINIQPVFKLVFQPVWQLGQCLFTQCNRLFNCGSETAQRLNNQLNVWIHDTAGYRVNKHSNGCQTGYSTDWQPVLSCKWGIKLSHLPQFKPCLQRHNSSLFNVKLSWVLSL